MSKTCDSCKDVSRETIPYIIFESGEARHERREKRLVIALIVSIILTAVCNCAWLYAWCQYDYTGSVVTFDATQDGEGVNILSGGNINYGTETANNGAQTNANQKKQKVKRREEA